MKRERGSRESCGEERQGAPSGGDGPRYACRRCGLRVDAAALEAAAVCSACLERTFYKCPTHRPVVFDALAPAGPAADARQGLARSASS